MDNCGDNRFEIIGKAKKDLLKSTNIDGSKDEMKVLDNFLFRCWQMGWLNQYNLTSDAEGEEILTCEKYKVEEALNYCDELDSISGSHNMLNWGKQMIEYLFGSKCLLDAHEDNFAKTDLEPYTEQREDLIPPNSGELESQEADKQFNTIIKDSFAKERRLNIAAQIVASMVGSDDWTTWRGGTNKEIWHNMAKSSLEIADALIDECEKKGGIK